MAPATGPAAHQPGGPAAAAVAHPFDSTPTGRIYSPVLAQPAVWNQQQQQRLPLGFSGGAGGGNADSRGYYTPPQGQTPSCQAVHGLPSRGGRLQRADGGAPSAGLSPRRGPAWELDRGPPPTDASHQDRSGQQQRPSPLVLGGAGGVSAWGGSGSPAARKAMMLAQRAGAGAAECFQW